MRQWPWIDDLVFLSKKEDDLMKKITLTLMLVGLMTAAAGSVYADDMGMKKDSAMSHDGMAKHDDMAKKDGMAKHDGMAKKDSMAKDEMAHDKMGMSKDSMSK
jgi:pentapeptide MXKDX repeat protein